MKFTLVTPILNGSEHLPQLMKSIRQQTYQDWEHLIVDGGSTDGTPDLVRQLQTEEKRLSLVEAPGSSIYQAIFQGFSQAQGEVCAWINCDDAYTPWALASVAEHLSFHDDEWVTGFPGAWDTEGRLRFVRPYALWPQSFIARGWFHADFLGFIQAESIFMRKALLGRMSTEERAAVTDARLAGDYILWRVLARYAPLKTIPTVLGGFCLHGANRSLVEDTDYMDEVYQTGVGQVPGWFGPRAGRLFQCLSSIAGFFNMQNADVRFQRELGLTRTDPPRTDPPRSS